MRRTFASYTPVYWTEAVRPSVRFYLELLANQMSPLPYSVAKYCLPRFAEAAREIAASLQPDLLFCDFLSVATSLSGIPLRPRVVFQHNVESILRKRQWQAENTLLKRWVFATEWQKTSKIEAQICRSFDHVIAVSEEDRRAFQEYYGAQQVSVTPTGVDTDYFRPQPSQTQPGRLVFVGSMDWYPNEHGVIWFLREVYPRVQQKIASATLTIVGREPSKTLAVAAGANSGVTITGRVADVRPYLAECDVAIVPLRIGGGTRIKIPEAMAMGKAVVSTSIGSEGLPFKNRDEICIADDPHEFSETIVELLKDRARRTALGEAARRRVVKESSWDLVVDGIEEILTNLAATAPSTRMLECLASVEATR